MSIFEYRDPISGCTYVATRGMLAADALWTLAEFARAWGYHPDEFEVWEDGVRTRPAYRWVRS